MSTARVIEGAILVTDLAAGIAAEHLVCADLLLQGYRAFLADQNCPYDVAVEANGRLIRIQVKGTRAYRLVPQRRDPTPAYIWQTRRGGKGGQRIYGAAEFDVLACVALDIREIAYLHVSRVVLQTIQLRPPHEPSTHANARHRTIDQYPFQAALEGSL